MLFGLVHLECDGITDEPIEALSLAGGESFDNFPLALGYDHINPVVSFLVVARSCFLLGVRIFGHAIDLLLFILT